MLLERFVREVHVEAGGLLLAVGPGRLQRAAREGRLHHELAALANATNAEIARFASTHGLLRVRAATWVHRTPAVAWSASILRLGQRDRPAITIAAAWARGERVDLPSEAAEAGQLLRVAAILIPRPILQDMLAFFSSEPSPVAPEVLKQLAKRWSLPELADLTSVTGTPDRESLRLAGELFEMMVYQVATARQLDDSPDNPPFSEMAVRLLVASPEALRALIDDPEAQAAVEETADDWRRAAGWLVPWVRLVRLLNEVRSCAPDAAAAAELGGLLASQLGYLPPPRLTPAEIADEVTPLALVRIEGFVTQLGAWPPSDHGPLPTASRALIALWRELHGGEPPRGCQSAGCGGVIYPPSKQRYCDSCRREREAKRMRGRRGRARRIAAEGHTRPKRGAPER